MQCFECFETGAEREAIGLCHHCSAALCAHHAIVVPDPIMTTEPLFKTVILPKRARLLLRSTCKQALAQRGGMAGARIANDGTGEHEQETDPVLMHG